MLRHIKSIDYLNRKMFNLLGSPYIWKYTMIRFTFLITNIFFFMGIANSAEYPNMRGTWEQVSIQSANSGTTDNPLPINFIHEVNPKRPTLLIIDKNEGPLFSGKRISGFASSDLAKLSGTHLLVGAFKPDGKNFIMSEDADMGIGDVSDNMMNICHATILTTQNSAACLVYKKIK